MSELPMRFHVLDGSRVLIDLRAAGLLRSLAHSPTLRVAPESFAVEFVNGEAALVARFRADAIEVPDGMSEGDRDKMRDNLKGPDVLDAKRHPTIEFRGRYAGTTEGGTLSGELVVRGQPTRVAMPVRVARQWETFAADASWEGTLTGLGVKPYKALLGAIKLEDWIGLRLEVRFRESL
jgi:polyisoprenoid-binding protein YceI